MSQPYLVEVMVEVELRLILKLSQELTVPTRAQLITH